MCHQPRQRVLAAVLVAALVCGTWARPFAGFGKDNTLRVLAIGDSITQGSVPSKNMNHPYTIQLQQQLQQAFPGRSIDVDNAGEVQSNTKTLPPLIAACGDRPRARMIASLSAWSCRQPQDHALTAPLDCAQPSANTDQFEHA
jgi:lysophospholipase L1-like esterase